MHKLIKMEYNIIDTPVLVVHAKVAIEIYCLLFSTLLQLLRLHFKNCCYKMKSLVIFLAVVAATFAWPNLVDEQRPAPNSSPFRPPWYLNKNINSNKAAKEQHFHKHGGWDVFEAGQIYLILGNNNLFLSAINYGGTGGENYIQSIKSQQDGFCRFAVSILENGKVALRDFGGGGRYLQLNPGSGVNSIRPTSDVIDDSAQFEVEVGGPGPWKGAHYVYLKANNGKYWGIVNNGPVRDNIAADYAEREEATRLIVLEAL